MKPAYKRVLLKLSGEALMGEDESDSKAVKKKAAK